MELLGTLIVFSILQSIGLMSAVYCMCKCRPPVVVFVSSKMGTLLLAEAINKVRDCFIVHTIIIIRSSQFFSYVLICQLLVCMETWLRRGGVLWLKVSWMVATLSLSPLMFWEEGWTCPTLDRWVCISSSYFAVSKKCW